MLARALVPSVVTAGAIALALTVRVVHPAAPPQAQLPVLPPEGGLTWECRDSDAGELIPCKVTLVGVDGTPAPRFTRTDIGREDGDAVLAYDRIMSISGVGVAHVPVGTYDVWVSRGPEWDVYVVSKLKITARGAVVRARLKHSVESHGWLSGDFHVHAAASPDSRVPMRDRIYEFVSDGVELIVSTDHNVVSDYAPIIAKMGAGQYITSLPGDEITTATWGHFGAFPLVANMDRAGQGAIHAHARTAHDMFFDVREGFPEAVIDVHHPRLDNEIGYFNLGRFESRSDRADRPGFSFDFDAVEVLNGYQDAERRSVDRVVEDWFELLQHGHLVTATGNSDTHHLDYNIGGYPRNYVRVQDDDPSRLRTNEIPRAVKGHHLFFTTAPFVRAQVGGASYGDVARAKDGKATLELDVQAAAWVSVSSARIYVDGREVHRFEIPPSTAPVRLHTSYEIVVPRDSWVVVRVDGDKPLAPVVGDLKRFDVRPFALTNPIFLDVDGNGRYDPPQPHGPHDALRWAP